MQNLTRIIQLDEQICEPMMQNSTNQFTKSDLLTVVGGKRQKQIESNHQMEVWIKYLGIKYPWTHWVAQVLEEEWKKEQI